MFLNRWSSIVTRQPCIPVLPHVTPGPLPVAVSLSFDKSHLASWKSLKLSHKKRQLQQAVLLVNLACTIKILKRLTDQLILWYFEETILGPHTPLVIVSIAFPFPPPPRHVLFRFGQVVSHGGSFAVSSLKHGGDPVGPVSRFWGEFWLGLEAFAKSRHVSFLFWSQKRSTRTRELSVQRGEGLWKFHYI